MEVFVQGKHKLSLTQADFAAQGGEGSVYVKGGTAYKVYTNPKKMIPIAKIAELAAITEPRIIRPRDVLMDRRRNPVGYSMASVPDAIPLCQTFTRAFRDRKRLGPDRMLRLIRELQKGVGHVHAAGILIVDLNETNFLVDSALEHVYFIDVDSYQTPGFPATALMESVRDRHATAFTALSDWFSFAVVSFQMFTGIHPYKGKHAALKTLEERMQANVSVLSHDVSVPAACLPFDVIPYSYREWYDAVLDGGLRLPPPDSVMGAIRLVPCIDRQSGSQMFDVEELHEYGVDIAQVIQGLVVTVDGVALGGAVHLHSGVQIGIASHNCHAVAAWIENGYLRLYDLHAERALAANIMAERVTALDGRLAVKQGEALLEVEFMELPATTLVKTRTAASVMPQATQLFEGVALQNMLGAWYATLLPARGKAYQVRIPQLDGYQVVEARFQMGVLMVVAQTSGRYDKLIMRFDEAYRTYDIRIAQDLAAWTVNFVVLDSGLCLHLNEHDELEVFSNKIHADGMKVIADPAIRGDCKLFKNGSQALFARGRSLYKFSMRK